MAVAKHQRFASRRPALGVLNRRDDSGHECEHIVLGLVHAGNELGHLVSELVSHGAPLLLGGIRCLLHEDCADGGRHQPSLRLVGEGQRIAHEMHAATLPRCLQHLRGSRLDAGAAVADHQLDATKAAAVEAAQELRPELLGFARADLDAQYLALAFGVDADSHYYGHAHDSTSLASPDVSGVDPKVRPVAFQGAIEEGGDLLVQFAAQL
jgi:hypothetical protein